MWQDIENHLSHADPDRRMAALFASRTIRRRLLALYAFNDELARIRDRVTEPMLGDLRLAWWREVLEEIYDPAATVRAHQVAAALAHGFSVVTPPRMWMDRMINVRARDLGDEPFETLADLKDYAERSSGTLMRVAVWLCAPDAEITPAGEAAIQHAGIAWTMTGLLRGFAADLDRNRNWLPLQVYKEAELEPAALGRERDAESVRRLFRPVIESAEREHREARARFSEIPAEAAPAMLYAALIPAYLGRMSRKDYDAFNPAASEPPLFRKQTRMVWASARGRV